MNNEQISGKFDQLKGQIKTTWGKLTDDEIMTYEGKREQFFGTVKEKYGIAKEEAEKQIAAFSKASDTTTSSSSKA